MKTSLARAFLAGLCLTAAAAPAGAAAPPALPPAVTVSESAKAIVLDNGRLRLTLDKKTGYLTSIVCKKDGKAVELANGREGMYFDANAAGYVRPTQAATCTVV